MEPRLKLESPLRIMFAVISKFAFFRFAVQVICLAGAVISSIPAHAAEPVVIGVLAFRPKPQTLQQWQPLAGVLKRAIPERDFIVEAYTYPEMEQATASKHLDFLLTNPGHYVLLAKRIGLTAPLATLAIDDHGHPATEFGGVIFSRSDRGDIQSLSDLKGRTIATASTDSLGGYQMQAYELSIKGVKIRADDLIVTGMPHDNVVMAVLSGRADAGFVRTGVLEDMAREGELEPARIKVLNLQSRPGFQLMTSTRLYPEWPFASLPSTDENLARRVAAALFTMEENAAVTPKMGIHGFVVPADYTPVADLLKELRMPPFDEAPSFGLQDVWNRYSWPLIGALIAIGVILLLGLRLLLTKRKLATEHGALLQQELQLKESESHLHTVIQNEPECIKTVDAEGRLVQMNPAGLAMIEADSLDQVAGRPVIDVIAPEYREEFNRMHKRVIAGETILMEFEVLGLKGGRRWLETHAAPMLENGKVVHLAVTRDITERKKMEREIRQLAFYDDLTKLPNRRLLDDRLGQAMSASKRTGFYGAVIFLDLDNFKPLNDTHGHEVGDLLLIEAAFRLRGCIREMDTVARFGGDEFVVVLSELDADKSRSAEQARIVAEKIRSALSAPYRLTIRHRGRPDIMVEHHCTVSMGVVLFVNHECNQTDILKSADVAMYQAKESGRNNIKFFEPELKPGQE
jgi:diguanylate cyclase (GGDEF)-like protein/PAS domain S-box-containing protein